ncbi:MAG TPA: DUF4412 domain-containing protein [Chthoniobacterales bacterium]|jgi:hypothetical protein|nr:DUF4412 domain-containing protein [Chthoniobacterales bacterium]
MRTIFAVFSSLTLVVFAAKGDYIIKQEVETMGHVQQIGMKIKGAKARLDTEQTSTIIDSNTGETIMLIHGQKVFLKIAPEQLKAQSEAVKSLMGTKADETPSGIELKPTGKRQSINGYETEEYVTNLNGTDMSIFISKDFPDYMKIIEAVDVVQRGPGMDIFRTMAISPAKYPGMPIRTEAKFLGQRVVVTLKSVQQTDLTDADFSLPADYKELNPGGLPGKTNPSQ